MKKKYLFLGILVFVLLMIVLIFPKKNIVCIGNNCFEVELAKTLEEKKTGLMNREFLDEDWGMLFVYEEYGDYSFWMKDTHIPLDIIWIKDDRVVYVYQNAVPCEDYCISISPNLSANYVLEINSGLSEKLEIGIGDKVEIK